ncbi:complex 1 protein [Tuber indicum]|nr:complex 1 protein [Tuber indicum]
MKRSGIQRDVLALYRLCLREAGKKPKVLREQEVQDNFRNYARENFRAHLDIDRRDFATIEHLLRVGQRKLEVYSQPGIKNIA